MVSCLHSVLYLIGRLLIIKQSWRRLGSWRVEDVHFLLGEQTRRAYRSRSLFVLPGNEVRAQIPALGTVARQPLFTN